jgi:7,8-dihydropterin-6-yl-methyl-4-(beta-D-ribofuranosyl)aminobenzene 5'-phosphate synthase
MKLLVLVDNNTIIDQYYVGEPALSFWIEADNKRILFDTGYSDLFMKNAEKLNIDLRRADYLVLSHGHFDHTGGIEPYIDLVGERAKNINLVAHPLIFNRKIYEGFDDIGTRKRKEEIAGYFDLNLSRKPLWLTKDLCFLGQIPRRNNFEAKTPLGIVIENGRKFPDYLMDDSALVYKSRNGLVIITGCSHSGICNIVEYAKRVCGRQKILDIVGGFHLLNSKRKILDKTIEYFKSCKIVDFHPCHCTDLRAKIELGKHFPIREVGTGLVLKYK